MLPGDRLRAEFVAGVLLVLEAEYGVAERRRAENALRRPDRCDPVGVALELNIPPVPRHAGTIADEFARR
jgi:hypothetical protein